MVMRHRSFFAAAFAVLAAAPLAAISALERGVAFVFALVAPAFADKRDFRLAPEGPVLTMTGQAVDPALQQSMRHEAGHRQRAASRSG
jgi:hypothetical protein